MNDTATKTLIFMITFWIMILVFSAAFGVQLAKTDITQHDQDASNINVLNAGSTLLKIMTFQFAEVPALLGIFLDLFLILTILVFVIFIRG